MTSQHYLNQPGDLMKLPPDTLLGIPFVVVKKDAR